MSTDENMPKVCVLMMVYNHARWVGQAIEGVLGQQTNFSYKLLISEDCSTDDSREIVKSYQERYPNKIELLLNERNLGMAANGRRIKEHARGEYIASCEGDDFWTDPHKLQIQVDFLDSHPDYAACYHAVKIVDVNGQEMDLQIEAYTGTDEYDYPLSWAGSLRLPGQSCSCVCRNPKRMMNREVVDAYEACRMNGDQKTIIVLLSQGKIRRMGRCMACYRRTYTGDSWNARTHGKDMTAFNYIGFLDIEKLANLLLPIKVNRHPEARQTLQNFLRGFRENKHSEKYRVALQMLSYDPWLFMRFALLDRLCAAMRPLAEQLLLRLERRALAEWSPTRYIIFGTGDFGRRSLLLLGRACLSDRVDCFFDNDARKAGSDLQGLPVHLPDRRWQDEACLIIIATDRYVQEMRTQLEEMGCVYGENMLSYHDFLRKLRREVFQSRHPRLYAAVWQD